MQDRSVIGTLMRRWGLVIGVSIAVAIIAFVAGNLSEETHEVKTKYFVREGRVELAGLARSPQGVVVSQTDWRTLSAPLKSATFVTEAAQEAGVQIDDVEEFVVENVSLLPEDATHMVTLTIELPGGADDAEALARTMLSMLDARVETEFREVLDARIESVEGQLDSTWERVRVLPAPQNGQVAGEDPVAGGTDAYDILSEQLTDLVVAREMEGPFVVVMDEPIAEKTSPRPVRNIAVGLAVGILAGLGLALALDAVDSRRQRASSAS